MRAYFLEAKYESLRMLRMPAFAIPFLLLPVGRYLLFAVLLFGAQIGKDPTGALFTFMGFSILGVMGPGMFGFGVTVAMEREQGLLKLKRALPMPSAASLVAKMLMSMLFVAIVMTSMVAASPVGHLQLTAGQLLSVSLINIAGALPFCALGILVGALASGKAAPAFVNLLYLPMLYLPMIYLSGSCSAAEIYAMDRLDLTGIPSRSTWACQPGYAKLRLRRGSCAGARGCNARFHDACAASAGAGWLVPRGN